MAHCFACFDLKKRPSIVRAYHCTTEGILRKQTAKIETSLLLECVEISGDVLVWKDFRKTLNLKPSNLYTAGKQVQAVYKSAKKGRTPRAYVVINMMGASYQLSYPKVILWAKTKEEPKTKCWLVDGDPLNLSVSNVTSKFVGWWDRQGVDNPCKKAP